MGYKIPASQSINRGCGGIGIHKRIKISRCFSMRVRSPPAPLKKQEIVLEIKEENWVLIEAFITVLGGNIDGLKEEFDRFSREYPNITIIMLDFAKNAMVIVNDVNEQGSKIELLKKLLVEANVLKVVATDVGEGSPAHLLSANKPEQDEIKINDIIWHQAVTKGDLPN